ncbi:MAG: CHAP domain-containing protein [Nocardioides sp.]
MTPPPRSRLSTLPPAVVLVLLALLVALLMTVLPAAPVQASSSYLCTGYSGCADAGYAHHGYRKASDRMWWLMYTGHNCTNYVAYRLVKQGMSAERPWDGTGMAYHWGRANRRITDDTPMVGSVAWWDAGDSVGSSGHVGYVEKVISNRRIVISEDSWSGDFHWRTIRKRGGGWPTGFIHFADRAVKAEERPRITGEPAVGSTLTADLGAWTPAASYAVQWRSDGEPIPGATGRTLTPSPADLRSRLSVTVTASAPGHLPGTATSDRTAAITRGTMTVATAPTLTGTARVDEVLILSPGAASPDAAGQVVRWYADGERIRGASSNRLRLTQEQIRHRITATVVFRREGYRNLPVATSPTDPVAAGRFEITEPFTLGGTPRVGRTLTVTPGTFTPTDAEVTYTWLRGDEPVVGATGPSYAVGPDDLGARLSVRVDLRHTGYRDASVTLPMEARVTTVPTLKVASTGGDHRAVVVLRVTAPGVEAPGGLATVRVNGHEVTGRVEDGRLRVVLRGLDPGKHSVRVAYAGTQLIEAAGATDQVRVRRS